MTPAYAVVTLHIPLPETNFHNTSAVLEDQKTVTDVFKPVADSMGGRLSVKILPDNTEAHHA